MGKLIITIPGDEFYDEYSNEFHTVGDKRIQLQHSLMSIAKWEAIWKKAYLSYPGSDPKTDAEVLSYIKCMTVTQNVDDEVYSRLTIANLNDIRDYLRN